MAVSIVATSRLWGDGTPWGTTPVTVPLPTGTQEGDLVLVMCRVHNPNNLIADVGYPTATGWGLAYSVNSDIQKEKFCVLARKMVGGDDMSSVVLTRNGEGHWVSAFVLRVTGAYDDANWGNVIQGNTYASAPPVDPPSLTPTWYGPLFLFTYMTNGLSSGYLWADVPGADWVGGVSYNNLDTDYYWITYSKQGTGMGAEDPPATNYGPTGSGGIGVTLAIRPAATGGPHSLGTTTVNMAGHATLTGDPAAKRHYWRVPTTATNGTTARLSLFNVSGSSISTQYLEGAVTAQNGYFELTAPGDAAAAGTKRFALIHNWNGVLATTSIYGGPCIAEKMVA